jgi:HEAT repeat protein
VRLRPALAGILGFGCLVVVAAAPDHAPLVARLGERTSRERDEAAARLLEIGPAAAPALEEGARSRDAAVRSRSAALLALVRGDADGAIRARLAGAAVRDALRTSGGLAAGSAPDARIAALMPESAHFLAAAARVEPSRGLVSAPLVSALARHAAGETLASLATLVRDERIAPSAALEAAHALDAAFGASPERADAVRGQAPRALAILEEAMDSPHAPTRRAALAVYGALAGAPGAERVAAAAVDADPSVRAECARVLGLHAPGASAAALRRLAADPAAPVREAALTALLALPGPPRAEPAVAAAGDASPAVRAAAARLLGREATPDTVPCLETLAADPSLRVRAAARRALASLR